jgi:hypothetical protein
MGQAACKKAVDDLFAKHIPAYMMLLGCHDVFPLQDIDNPAEDEDFTVPSDLPYACDAPYSRSISAFTGPGRVVGRLPDLPGKQKTPAYLLGLLTNAMAHKPVSANVYHKYFAVSAQVWRKSTEMTLRALFSDSKALVLSPKAKETTDATYTKTQLKPSLHFYNCHGANTDPNYYGQRGSSNYPVALNSGNLIGNITKGTVAAAECCYGAQLYDAAALGVGQAVCYNYLGQGAIAFVGSSTIAYGPADSNALADLITQYYVRSILKGASSGRALLEARQQFLTDSGPQLDPYELKTLAQFYLLGDPSVQPAIDEDVMTTKIMAMNTISNSRAALFSKGMSLKQNLQPSHKAKRFVKSSMDKEMQDVLISVNFGTPDQEFLYGVDEMSGMSGLQKKLMGQDARYRAFIKRKEGTPFETKVLVVKEGKDKLLGWRLYERR